MQNLKLVCFDLDDTLIREYHSVMIPCLIHDKELEHDLIQKREMANEIDYITADILRAELLAGLKVAQLTSHFFEYAKPLKNIKETIMQLHQRGMKCILITVGPIQVAKIVADFYGFDAYYGSSYETLEGVFTGRIGNYVRAEHKIDCLKDYCQRHDIAPSDCMSIGDGATDIPLFRYCGHSIAINSSEEVKSQATHSIETDDLMAILKYIK